MKKILDYVAQCQLENCQADILKGTQVSFKLPSAEIYEENGQKVTVGIGIVISREEDKYTINYKSRELTVKSIDIYATLAQLESFPIYDSILYTNVIKSGNDNDFANMLLRLFDDISEDDIEKVVEIIDSIGADKGEALVCFVADEEPKDTPTTLINNLHFGVYKKS